MRHGSVGEKLQTQNGFLEVMSNATKNVMGLVSSTFFVALDSLISSFGGSPNEIHMHPNPLTCYVCVRSVCVCAVYVWMNVCRAIRMETMS